MMVREAGPGDGEPVVRMIKAMLQEMARYGERALDEAEKVRSQLRSRFTDSLEKEDHVYLVALADVGDELTGVVEASVVSPYEMFQPSAILHVHALYVQPRWRRQGIGRVLLGQALTWGKERGCVEAELSVLPRNPARLLYERVGFDVVEWKMRLRLRDGAAWGPSYVEEGA